MACHGVIFYVVKYETIYSNVVFFGQLGSRGVGEVGPCKVWACPNDDVCWVHEEFVQGFELITVEYDAVAIGGVKSNPQSVSILGVAEQVPSLSASGLCTDAYVRQVKWRK